MGEMLPPKLLQSRYGGVTLAVLQAFIRIEHCVQYTMTDRITIEPGKRSGQPCIRGLRITVWDILSWLAAGMTEQEILDDYPELDPADFRAVYEFAASMGRRVAL